MSKYDDVQGFKDKVNLKEIDYKEFPRDDAASAPLRWSIVDQVAGHGGIAAGSSPQPTPISSADLSANAPFGLEQPAQPKVAVAENTALPGHIAHNFDRFAPPAAPKPAKVAQPENPRTAPAQGNYFTAQASEPPSTPQGESQRFKQMFSKKASSSASETLDAGRNTLLKPLLESIASCR